MSWDERIELYQKIEAHRKRPLIVYVTSKRLGAAASISSDALPQIIEHIDALPEESKALDFLTVSFGGDPMVAWRIMTLLRQRVDNVAVMIPQSAYSAATLVAFGADEIVMHPNGHLGPVDMQITTNTGSGGQARTFSTEDISTFLDFVRDSLKITDQEHLTALFEMTCKEVGTLGIGFTARSSKLALDLGERLLAMHMKEDEVGSKLRSIVQTMSRKFQSHAYPVNRKEALEIGLPINKERDKTLEKMMWDVWLSIEKDLKERVPFDVLIEVLNSSEGSKLLSPVPQFDVTPGATMGTHYNTGLEDIEKHSKIKVEPVDFEHLNALVESSRLAHSNVTKGKILACRMPDLLIRYNRVITSLEWEKVKPKKAGKS